jgi:phospholipase C
MVHGSAADAADPVTTPANHVGHHSTERAGNKTTTPIKHVVVIFDENVSYDHYFGTYPKAANTDGSKFHAATGTPTNDNLVTAHLLHKNPNAYTPSRLSPDQALTCDQNHAYGPEQAAFDNGKMDKFVESVSVDTCSGGLYGAPGLSMDYFDGNTVTGMWNYAQNFAMSDRFFGSAFGPSTPGAIELASGQTHGFTEVDSKTLQQVPTPGSYVLASPDAQGVGTLINDPDPAFDDCSDGNHVSTNTLAAARPSDKNIGDLLNARHVTWGWFQGGFRPTTPAGPGTTYSVCGSAHDNIGGTSVVDYSPHHNPFAYYKSTSNPHHLAPSSVTKIGKNDRANHNYDLSDFDAALKAGVLPKVSFLKAASYQDGHAGYSDPIDEQHFLVKQINAIQKSKFWKNTAIIVAYDDSDGWYDHAFAGITNGSKDTKADGSICLTAKAKARGRYQDRCGPGPRLPLLVISPYSRQNFVDGHTVEQASITRFIEDNWQTGSIGDHSFDKRAGSLTHLFDFKHPDTGTVLLRSDGTVKHKRHG